MIYLILSIIILGLCGYIYNLSSHQVEVLKINSEIEKKNQQLDSYYEFMCKEYKSLNQEIINKQEIVNRLIKTAEDMRESAKKQADQLFQERLAEIEIELDEHYQAIAAKHEEEISAIDKKKKQEEDQLQDLKNKQLAYIEAMQRQEEMDSKQDYYRLIISDIDLGDIRLLRELQNRFTKKEAVDKLIWENYYKSAYDLLMSHLFSSTAKVCGIYKITDLVTGKSYIGQSVDIRERFRQHIKTSLAYGKANNKLYQAMQTSGQSNFTFEVLEEVPRTKLNEREIFWIDFYKTREMGLNSTRGGS